MVKKKFRTGQTPGNIVFNLGDYNRSTEEFMKQFTGHPTELLKNMLIITKDKKIYELNF